MLLCGHQKGHPPSCPPSPRVPETESDGGLLREDQQEPVWVPGERAHDSRPSLHDSAAAPLGGSQPFLTRGLVSPRQASAALSPSLCPPLARALAFAVHAAAGAGAGGQAGESGVLLSAP